MGWPYHFLDLDRAEKHARRLLIDRYARYAQLSALLPVAVFLLYRVIVWAVSSVRSHRGPSYDAIPNSPSLKVQRRSSWTVWAVRLRQLRWRLGDDVYILGYPFGQLDQWLIGGLWTLWLLVLCVLETGQDYLHLTKRFGAIAVSQLPVLYLMALKSLNPFVYVFRSSHEQVNRVHRVFGRVIYTLLCLHVAFYLNYFVGVGILGRRLFAPVVFAGVLAFVCMNLLSVTALRTIRQLSYRLFFITHLFSAFAIPALLLYHAHPARLFVVEAVLVFLADLVSRKLDTTVSEAILESIPGTNLVKITAPVPATKANRFNSHPGSHVYLSIPAKTLLLWNSHLASIVLFQFLFNPFTVAAVDEESGNLTLVARCMKGPLTTGLAGLASRSKEEDSGREGIHLAPSLGDKMPLSIEGPYGAVRYFPNLAGGEFSRVLLVAGGIGATFIVPLYRAITQENPNAKVKMVWAVRGAGDATWAVTESATEPTAKSILDDVNVQIFITEDILNDADDASSLSVSKEIRDPLAGNGRSSGRGQGSTVSASANAGGDVELSTIAPGGRRSNRYAAQHNRKRPDLKQIVDSSFKHGADERIAIVVCGPAEMARELRAHVRPWVMKGRYVWWHNEGFGL
ncbi:hypothetical protein VTK73DRAFT_9659 [Phialemonium thermophilum]|uniref:FAD-binding FR-type domain-containing protein n=1 Tax=Phialemonium thermophilum TaxID=223376 RepID=A0ABR3XJ17_9PEZI